jgi:UDP-N-acetylmuramoyl-L-alanyl-D-glutamate--2,6-diaminopimelate ligase
MLHDPRQNGGHNLAGDVILIAGKGHEREQIFRDRVIPFSDREIAEAVLAAGR